MNAQTTLAHPRRFDSLHAVPGTDDYITFGRGSVKPSQEKAAALRDLARPWGAHWLQSDDDAPFYKHCFFAERALVEQPGYVAEVIIDAQNHGLLVPVAFDCTDG